MRTYLFSFGFTAVLAALFTPCARWMAMRIGAVSAPGGRHVHARSVPRLGGIAIAAAFACTFGLLLSMESSVAGLLQTEPLRMVGLLGGALICFLVGVLDDTRRVRALYKLYAQIIAAVLAYICGFRIDVISLPFGNYLPMGIFSLPITVVWIIAVVNAINLIDGLDGLAAGIVFFAGLTNFVAAIMAGNVLLAVVMATMLGAVFGFLFFNFNPARIFMGDSGSYFLGFVLGTSSLVGQKSTTTIALAVPTIALGLPLVDTLFTIVRRFLERRSLFSPDRGHIHHRLLDLGLTHRRSVMTLYAVTIVFSGASIAMILGRDWHAGVALIVVSVVAIGLFRAVGYFDYLIRSTRQKERVRTPETEVLRHAVPEAMAALGKTDGEDAVWATIEQLLTHGGVASAELRDGTGATARTWTIDAKAPADEVVSSRFPIGRDARARAHFVFRWRASDGEVNPQMEILFQLTVDALAHALTRAGSAYAPRPAELPAPAVASEPGQAAVASAGANASA